MRKKKSLTSIIVLFFFIIQIIVPVNAISINNPKYLKKIENSIVEKIFDESVKKNERILIKTFLEYIYNSSIIRKDLRRVNNKINELLSKEVFWNNITITNDAFSSLFSEAKATRDFLLKKSIPVEKGLSLKEIELEATFKDAFLQLDKAQVNDNLLKVAKYLDGIYNSHDKILSMKKLLLFKISGLYKNVCSNYLFKSNIVTKKVQNKYSNYIDLLHKLSSQEKEYSDKISVYKEKIATQNSNFDKIAIKSLAIEKKRTQNLIVENDRQISLLKSKGNQNELYHSKLLEKINFVLKNRIDIIDRKISDSNQINNFLYLPDSFKVDPDNASRIDSLKNILIGFIKETENRIKITGNLKKKIDSILASLDAEKSYYFSMIDSFQHLNKQEKKEKVRLFKEKFETYKKYFSIVQNRATEILNLSANLNFLEPESIYSNRLRSSETVKLNNKISDFIIQFENVDASLISYDLMIGSLILDIAPTNLAKNKYYKMLTNESSVCSENMRNFISIIKQLKNSYVNEKTLTKDLKSICSDVVKEGNKLFTNKISILEEFLINEKSASSKPYYIFLKGVKHLLKSHQQIVKDLVKIYPQNYDYEQITTGCTQCDNIWHPWNQISFDSMDFLNVLKQLKMLKNIEDYCSKNILYSDNKYDLANILFELSDNLNHAPVFKLHNDSIDIIFYLNGYVAIKGVGNPKILQISQFKFDHDIFLDTPYIGWDYDPLSAFNEALSSVFTLPNIPIPNIPIPKIPIPEIPLPWDPVSEIPVFEPFPEIPEFEPVPVFDYTDLIVPPNQPIFNKSSELIDNAIVIGKILIKNAIKIKNAIEIADEVVSDINEITSKTYEEVKKIVLPIYETILPIYEGTKDLLSNIINNVLFDSDGSISWTKVGAYSLGIGACYFTGGLACLALGIGGGSDVVKGMLDTASMPKYDWISKDYSEPIKIGVDIVGLFVGGFLNYKSAIPIWNKLGKVGKGLVVIGVNPEDLMNSFNILKNNLSKQNWKGISSAIQLLKDGKLRNSLTKLPSSIRNLLINSFKASSSALNNIKDKQTIIGGASSIVNTISSPYQWLSLFENIYNLSENKNNSNQPGTNTDISNQNSNIQHLTGQGSTIPGSHSNALPDVSGKPPNNNFINHDTSNVQNSGTLINKPQKTPDLNKIPTANAPFQAQGPVQATEMFPGELNNQNTSNIQSSGVTLEPPGVHRVIPKEIPKPRKTPVIHKPPKVHRVIPKEIPKPKETPTIHEPPEVRRPKVKKVPNAHLPW